MKPLFIAGNWKSNKTIKETKDWIEKFRNKELELNNITVVICAPFTVLSTMRQLPFSLGAQNISMYDEGAYTGEITGKMIKEVADWVLIGHSERRKYFHETDDVLCAKVEKAYAAGLKVIYCVQDDTTPVPSGVDVVAYEPVWAIGSGTSDIPQNANIVIDAIQQKTGVQTVIYGGSVTQENVGAFVNQSAINGVLSGGVSLDSEKFSQLLYEAKKHI